MGSHYVNQPPPTHKQNICFVLFKSYFCQGTKKVKEVIKLVYFELLLKTETSPPPPPPKQVECNNARASQSQKADPFSLISRLRVIQAQLTHWGDDWLTWVPECSKLYIATPENISRSCFVQTDTVLLPGSCTGEIKSLFVRVTTKPKNAHIYISVKALPCYDPLCFYWVWL